jgi:hypothetical protein
MGGVRRLDAMSTVGVDAGRLLASDVCAICSEYHWFDYFDTNVNVWREKEKDTNCVWAIFDFGLSDCILLAGTNN